MIEKRSEFRNFEDFSLALEEGEVADGLYDFPEAEVWVAQGGQWVSFDVAGVLNPEALGWIEAPKRH